MEIQIKRVENGYVVQVTKWDILTHKPEVGVYIEPTLDSVIERLRKL